MKCEKSVYIANRSIDKIDAVEQGYAEGYKKALSDFVSTVKQKFANDKNAIIHIEIIAEKLGCQ